MAVYFTKIMFFQLRNRVASSGNESNKLKAQVFLASSGNESNKLKAQVFSPEIASI